MFKLRWGVLASVAISMVASVTYAGSIRYVDDDAPLLGDGLSWDTAYRFLQDALAEAAGTPAINEIRVAQGVYKPDRDEASPDGTGERTTTFGLLSGVTLNGGYAGLGTPDPDARDIDLYKSVLSGDLLDNDVPTDSVFDPSLADNAFHVLGASVPVTVVDGFTICGGVTTGEPGPINWGGGLRVLSGVVTLQSCTFIANFSSGHGGAISVIALTSGAHLNLTDCAVVGNVSSGGGGISVQPAGSTGSVTLTNCEVSGNHSSSEGGGLEIVDGELTATDCTFANNIGSQDGGGIYADDTVVCLDNCTISGNSGPSEGGGMSVKGGGSSLTLIDCVFTRNSATTGGGLAIDIGNLGATLTGCTFDSNASISNGGGLDVDSAPTAFSDCVFIDNTAGNSGGGVFAGNTVTYTDCSFIGNSADSSGGGHWGHGAGFAGCLFANNTAVNGGGAVLSTESTSFVDCMFWNNFANRGGAVSGRLSFANCSMVANMAGLEGGAIWYAGTGHRSLVNCTLAGNTASGQGGGLYVAQPATATVSNCIIWANTDSTGSDESAQISINGKTSVEVNYCCIQGLSGALGGTGNIADDPTLFDLDGPDDLPGTEDDNVRLQPGSPCIDSGDNTAVPEEINTDLDGNPRFVDDPATDDTGNPGAPGPIVDMGAYEFQGTTLPPCPWDLNGDGIVNVLDLIQLVMSFGPCEDCPADFDDDGFVNVLDLIALIMNFGPCSGTECVWDVNGDGVVDQSDVVAVTSNPGPCDGCPEDVNGDGVVNGQDVAAVATHFGPCP